MTTHPILNIDDIEYRPWGHGTKTPGAEAAPAPFEARLGPISGLIGAQKLGYNVTIVPPGKRAFPAHSHRVNEEMFFILAGEGEMRVGDKRHKVRPGDIIACPAGGPETAHQLINTSPAEELKFLAVSTLTMPEMVDYPDSGKMGFSAEATGPDGKTHRWRHLTRPQGAIDYWDGEAGDK